MMINDTPLDTAGAGALDCHAAVQRLWDYLDGALSEPDLRLVDAHLAACAKCPPHFAFERAFLRAVRGVRAEHPRAEGLRSRVTAALAREGFHAR